MMSMIWTYYHSYKMNKKIIISDFNYILDDYSLSKINEDDHSQVEDLSFDISLVEGAVLTKNNSDGISEKLDDYSSRRNVMILILDIFMNWTTWTVPKLATELDLELGFKYFNTNGKLKSRKIKANLYGFFNGESLLVRGIVKIKMLLDILKSIKLKTAIT